MQKRAIFTNNWLGFAFIVPQLLLIFTFFYWPAGQALYWAFTLSGPGAAATSGSASTTSAVVSRPGLLGLGRPQPRLRRCARTGLAHGRRRWCWRCWSTASSRGHRIYRAVLVWPYAIAAPALGLAFRFMLAPEAGLLAFVNHIWPGIWDPTLNGNEAHGRHRRRLRLEICRLQFHLHAGGAAGDPALADRGGRHGRRAAAAPHARHPGPAADADAVLPAGAQHHRQLPGQLRHRRHHDRRRPGPRHQPDGLQDLFRRLQRPRLFGRRRAERSS